ncbi:GNAT family N-acetyltransferase [Kineococcus glutinatus]|uniref:GNAT family N-acetyltransferase n=1 Tax=Kineococcus glutinatus TaxID=1070872 RepID=A0ABP8VAP7_9ACTN
MSAAAAAGAEAPAGPRGADALDNPVLSSLLGAHAPLSLRRGRAVRYDPAVGPLAGLPADADDADWADLAAISGGREVVLFAVPAHVPAAAELTWDLPGVQLVDVHVEAGDDPEALRLGPADAAEMLELAERTRPGPFGPRTPETGTYLGVRRAGRLVAMAGQRLHPDGFAEVSAVCTDPSVRGQGLASRLVAAVVADARRAGRTAFLHASADNTGAIRLYEHLGFELRREVRFQRFRLRPHAPHPTG